MDLTTNTYLLLSAIAFIGGMVSAISGGAGMVLLPALLMAGVPPHLALGTNKLYTTAGLFTSAVTFIKKGLFQPRFWLAASIATLAGAAGGAGLAMLISNESLNYILPFILLTVTVYLFLPHNPKPITKKPKSTHTQAIAFSLGIYSGFIGAGTASIWTATAMRVFNIPLLEASALSRSMCFVANATALVVFMCLKQVDYKLGLILALTGTAGAYLGTKLALQYGKKLIKPVLLSVICIMTIKLALFDTGFKF